MSTKLASNQVDGLPVSVKDYGAVGDGVTDDTNSFLLAVAATPDGGLLEAESGKVYYFGELAGDTSLVTITKRMTLDWKGSKILLHGENDSTYTGTAFIKAVNTGFSMSNYSFEDTTFDIVNGPSRGVIPVLISNTTGSSEGYEIGPCHVIKGQSLVTATATDPNNFRAKGISLVGSCTADDVYYGVNLANNGDSFKGDFTLGRCVRALFAYGTKHLQSNHYFGEGRPASANVLISNGGASLPRTENYKIRSHAGALNGALDIVGDDQIGDPADDRFRNIDVEFIVDTLGANLSLSDPVVNLGTFATGGGFVSSGAGDFDNIKIDLQTELALTNPIVAQTSSPNYGTLELRASSQFNKYGLADSGFTIITGARHTTYFTGDLTATQGTIDCKYITGVQSNGLVHAKLSLAATNGFGAAGRSVAEYIIQGSQSGAGALTINQQDKVYQYDYLSAPVFTIGATGNDLTVDTTVYTDTNSSLSLHIERL